MVGFFLENGMRKISVIGLGAGGHARVIIDALQYNPEIEIIGLLDPQAAQLSEKIAGVSVLGGDDLLPDLYNQGIRLFFIGLGSVADTSPRKKLYEYATSLGFSPLEVKHPSAIVADSAKIGLGATILGGAIVGPSATLGANVILNTGAIVEHDCVLGDHVHLATGATLCGGVRIGSGSHIGARAVIRQYIQVGEAATVGAGAVVVKDVVGGWTVVGNPARHLER